MLMEEKITLDRETFKTLASDTRVGILKSLRKRRKMLTEISKEFGMSPSTIKEHLDSLSKSDLVVQIDDGHKWKYYELTRKGKDVLSPGETRIWVILGLSAVAIMLTGYDFLQRSFQSAFFQAVATGSREMAPAPLLGAESAGQAAAYAPYFHVMAFIVFAAIFGVSLGYILAKRRFYSF
jgi:DNA-binding transcriptional ArsR family regulator